MQRDHPSGQATPARGGCIRFPKGEADRPLSGIATIELSRHPAGVVALSGAGAHLMYLCDAGFGLYLLGHWVRECGTFDLAEGVRRLTSHQAGPLRHPPIAAGSSRAPSPTCCCSTPATVGVSPARRVADLPGGGPRTIRDPMGVHGVFVNGIVVFDGNDYRRLENGPGRVLDRFLPTGPAAVRNASA